VKVAAVVSENLDRRKVRPGAGRLYRPAFLLPRGASLRATIAAPFWRLAAVLGRHPSRAWYSSRRIVAIRMRRGGITVAAVAFLKLGLLVLLAA
jgi:hypothetical protein